MEVRPHLSSSPRNAATIARAERRLAESRRLVNALVRRGALCDRVRGGELPFYVARSRHGQGRRGQ